MSQQERVSSSAEANSSANPSSLISQHGSTRSTLNGSRFLKRSVLLIGGSVLLVLALSLAYKTFIVSPDDPIIVEGERKRVIQLDVLNAAGENRLAQRVTDYLRGRGFDVVEMGNAISEDLSQTIVIDRTGDISAARQVANALGVSEERIVQKLDPSLYLDVTVLIGKDYQSLKPWR